MANYYGTTVSRDGEVKKGKKNREAVEAIIAKYNFVGNDGEIEVSLSGDQIQIYGEEAVNAYKIDDEDWENECFDEFLLELAPYLKTPLVVQEVGNEKCRYVCAFAWVVKPDAKEVKFINIETAIADALK